MTKKKQFCISLTEETYKQFKQRYNYPLSTFVDSVMSMCVQDSDVFIQLLSKSIKDKENKR